MEELNTIADEIMASNGIPTIDAFTMSLYPKLALHTDNVHMFAHGWLFYKTVVHGLLLHAVEVLGGADLPTASMEIAPPWPLRREMIVHQC